MLLYYKMLLDTVNTLYLEKMEGYLDSLISNLNYSRVKMMSKKQWFVLLCIFWLYLLLGASIFFYVESQEELRKQFQDLEEKQIIGGKLNFICYINSRSRGKLNLLEQPRCQFYMCL